MEPAFEGQVPRRGFASLGWQGEKRQRRQGTRTSSCVNRERCASPERPCLLCIIRITLMQNQGYSDSAKSLNSRYSAFLQTGDDSCGAQVGVLTNTFGVYEATTGTDISELKQENKKRM